MRPLDESVLGARGATWRVLWRGRLTAAERRQIHRAIRLGEAVDEPYLAAFAVRRARERRQALLLMSVFVPVNAGLVGVIAWGACSGADAFACGLYRVLLVTWLLVVPLLAVWRTRGARRAERANLAVLAAAAWDGSDG